MAGGQLFSKGAAMTECNTRSTFISMFELDLRSEHVELRFIVWH